MLVSELNKLHAQKGVQKGNKLIFISSDGISETLHGYTISTYDRNYEPFDVYENTHTSVAMTPNIDTWDKAHDALYGRPDEPQFNSNLLNKEK